MHACVRLVAVLSLVFTPLLAIAQTGDDLHKDKNPVYRELQEKGVAVGAQALKAPAPTMPDGLDKQAQLKVLQKLGGDDYPLDELTRNSIVAPYILKFRDVDLGDKTTVGRGVDLWFIAHGNLEKLTSSQLQAQFNSNRKDNKMVDLKDADLAKRGIKVKSEGGVEESYVHVVGVILDRVQVSAANQTVITRTKDSIVVAGRLDARFNKDAEFPNLWRSVTIVNDKEQLGSPNPYDGAGMYMRLTRLHEPAGAIFVEYHQAFVEPKGWFDAPNMLRSKLPIVVQSEVRAFRRELMKAK